VVSLRSGQILSHYRLIEKIGEGGMGIVWKALDTILDRPVAIKVLHPDAAGEENRRRMFFDEARLASSLSQSSIVQVHEFAEHEGLRFIVMEYVEGRPLAAMLRHRRLQPDFIADLGHQMARALSKAHRKGLLHRDLKPSNIIVTPDGEAKLVDFGLATLVAGREKSISAMATTRTQSIEATKSGFEDPRQIVGTLPYMSPEQIRGERLDTRSDIFSFGTVLYEMATGQRPFHGSTNREIADEIQKTQPRPVHELVPKVPLELDRIIHKSLAKKPPDRYQTIEDLAVDLKRLGKDLESGSSPSYEAVAGAAAGPGAGRGRFPFGAGWPLGLSMTAGAVALTAAIFAWFNVGPGREPARVAVEETAAFTDASKVGKLRQLTFDGHSGVPIWSPDGRTIAYVREGRIQVISANGGTPRALETGTAEWVIPWNWTHDGTAVIAHYFLPDRSKDVTGRIDLYGAAPRVLVEDGFFADLHPDGETLAFASPNSEVGTDILTTNLRTGERTLIIEAGGAGRSAYKPQWSPSGDRLAYVRWNGFGHEIWVLDRADGSDREVDITPIQPGGHFEWTPDGQAIVIGGEISAIWSIWKIPVDRGRPVRLTPGSENDSMASVSPTGDAVVFVQQRDLSRVVVVDTGTGESDEPVQLSISARNAAVAPDGETVVFQALVNRGWQIWSAPIKGGGAPHPIIRPRGFYASEPAISEDGEILHIRSEMAPNSIFGKVSWSQSLWVSSLDGGRHRRIEEAGDNVSRLAPTPIRRGRILYASNMEAGGEVLNLLDEDGAVRVIFEETETEEMSDFDWGPGDEEILLMRGSGERGWRLVALDITTNEERLILSRGSATLGREEGALQRISTLALSPDRRQLAMEASAAEGEAHGLYLYELESKKFRRLREINEEVHSDNIRWSPDGSRITIDLHRYASDIFVLENVREVLNTSDASDG
jgi:Tol biopolymer transport system component/tRNA A-37 threonylcarbamoyl transferase component Bud32